MDKVDKIVSPREARSPAAQQPFIARSVAQRLLSAAGHLSGRVAALSREALLSVQ
jgi:hypothetical protein